MLRCYLLPLLLLTGVGIAVAGDATSTPTCTKGCDAADQDFWSTHEESNFCKTTTDRFGKVSEMVDYDALLEWFSAQPDELRGLSAEQIHRLKIAINLLAGEDSTVTDYIRGTLEIYGIDASQLPIDKAFQVFAAIAGQIDSFPTLHKPLVASLDILATAFMGESEDHPLAPILRMLDEIINESDAAAAAPITIPEAMRSIAKRLRSYTGEGDGIIERTTKSVLLFFGGFEKDALNQYASALELGAIYADLASFYIVDPVLWSELLQKWTVLAEKNEAAELAAYFQILKQSAAQRAGGSSTTAAKMKTMQASVRHVWHNCVAFLGAETAPLANGATPTSPFEAIASSFTFMTSTQAEQLENSPVDTYMAHLIQDTYVQGFAAAYVGSVDGKLFGGLSFPEKLIGAALRFIFGFVPTTNRFHFGGGVNQNVANFLDVIDEFSTYALELTATVSLSDPTAVFENPWIGSVLSDHCDTLELTLHEVKLDTSKVGKQFKKLVRKVHPDKPGGSTEKFIAVKVSESVLFRLYGKCVDYHLTICT